MTSLVPSYALSTWNAVTTVGSDAYHVLFAPFLLMELTYNLFILVGSILLMLLFFSKRRSFPKLYITFLIITVIVGFSDHYLSTHFLDVEVEPGEEIALFVSTFITMIWVSYFIVSKRVKATFVMDWKSPLKEQ